MKIGLYGGTFSPVHVGHVRAAKAFFDALSPDLLIIMPAGIPPHKSEWGAASAADRLEMCACAFGEISDKVTVSDYEITKSSKSYTFETVLHLLDVYKDADITVLCGEDMIMSLDEWYEAGKLMKLCSFMAIPRDDGMREMNKKIEWLRENYGADITVIEVMPLELSSTEIRNMIADGIEPVGLVPEKVLEIINEKHLYGS